jgi:hypothetical protein
MANIIVSKTSVDDLANAMSAIVDEFAPGKMVDIKKVETCITNIVLKHRLLGKNVDHNRRDNITIDCCLYNTLGQNIVLLSNYFTPGRVIDISTALLIVQHMLASWICL